MTVADQPGRPVGHRRRHGGADAAGAHRGAQRRHRRHRRRPAPARQLDVGALGTGPRADQPAQPVVVRRPGRHLRACATRRRRVDPLRHRPRPAQPTADRRAAAAIPDRRRSAADPPAAGTALPRQHRAAATATMCMRCSWTSPSPARSTPTACAMRCTPWSTATPTWRPASANSSTSRCRSSRPIPWRPGGISS